MSDEFRDAPQQLARAADRLLSEAAQGFDWQWTAGEPPDSVDVDAIILDKSQADYLALLETWHFLDEFIDARWHGFEKVGVMSWDEAMIRLAQIAKCDK
jgi:hypothetical protein